MNPYGRVSNPATHHLEFIMSYKNVSSFMQAKPNFFSDVLGKIAAAAERRRVRHTLHGLDDYLLKDLGISRSDIDRKVMGRHLSR